MRVNHYEIKNKIIFEKTSKESYIIYYLIFIILT